jgi:ferric-dicitrate binding protein FerR (iron transport regulator)
VYRTGIGQRSTILLPDSTEITLNHTSSLTVVSRNGTQGRQTLLEGEAFFRVRKNGTPFVVQTALGSVRVLGTEFNIRVRNTLMEVAVVGGRVRVTAVGGGRDSTVVIETGERTRIYRGGFPDAPETTPFGAEYPGWLHGKLLLDRSTIAGACEELDAQFGVTIVIQRAELGGKTVTGVVDGRTVDEALRTFCALAHVAYRHENDRYILY